MRNRIIIIATFTLLIVSCNSNTSDKEKELLKNEIELLKKENEVNSKIDKQENLAIKDKDTSNIIEEKSIEKSKKQALKVGFIIEEHSVGKFKIGFPVPDPTISDNYVIEKKKETIMTEEGPYEETLFNVLENGITTIKISPDYNGTNIDEIMVLSKEYKTIKGIGVNSTLKDFIKSYPKFKIFYTYVSDICFIQSDNSDIQYLIDKNGLKNEPNINSDLVELKLSDFDSNTKIIKIRIYK